jgi:hypothetical protein
MMDVGNAHCVWSYPCLLGKLGPSIASSPLPLSRRSTCYTPRAAVTSTIGLPVFSDGSVATDSESPSFSRCNVLLLAAARAPSRQLTKMCSGGGESTTGSCVHPRQAFTTRVRGYLNVNRDHSPKIPLPLLSANRTSKHFFSFHNPLKASLHSHPASKHQDADYPHPSRRRCGPRGQWQEHQRKLLAVHHR